MDLRDALLEDLKKQPGMTAEEVVALHPDMRSFRIKKVLRALCRSWGDVYRVKCSNSGGGHRRYRFYPVVP